MSKRLMLSIFSGIILFLLRGLNYFLLSAYLISTLLALWAVLSFTITSLPIDFMNSLTSYLIMIFFYFSPPVRPINFHYNPSSEEFKLALVSIYFVMTIFFELIRLIVNKIFKATISITYKQTLKWNLIFLSAIYTITILFIQFVIRPATANDIILLVLFYLLGAISITIYTGLSFVFNKKLPEIIESIPPSL